MTSFSMTDTIVARATPAGRGGVAIIRISGGRVRTIATGLLDELPPPRYAELTRFRDSDGETVDTGLALFFPAPHSFTGEDVLELHTHGSPVICDILIERICQLGARVAEPGEFSQRAFLNDKLDLTQAEAIADLIDSTSRTAARAASRSLQGEFAAIVASLNDSLTELRVHVEAAIDFPEEEIDFLSDKALSDRLDAVADEFALVEQTVRHGCLLRDGAAVVIAGRPNAGKSMLLNTLAGYDAAIVTEIEGTTRDLVREYIDIDGLPVRIIDTAGLRPSSNAVEAEGIRRAQRELERADHALVVVDAQTITADQQAALLAELPAGLACTIVRNKIDLTGEEPGANTTINPATVSISALTRAGIDALRSHLLARLGYAATDGAVTARRRHLESLDKARAHFAEARRLLKETAAGELMADELLQAQNALADITGQYTSDDLLGEIFASFCIGK
jgi:tRNA modification GTPase